MWNQDERLKGPWQIDYSTAPNQAMVSGIKRYVENGIMPGHFLTALFSDKLTDTFARADGTNAPLIKAWIRWIYNEMPSDLVGSLEKMAAHVIEIQKAIECHGCTDPTAHTPTDLGIRESSEDELAR